jgi:hypothetical protein
LAAVNTQPNLPKDDTNTVGTDHGSPDARARTEPTKNPAESQASGTQRPPGAIPNGQGKLPILVNLGDTAALFETYPRREVVWVMEPHDPCA